ncbi:hypothetical protein VTP01DRAFT_9400, partial [Rhizomucor pusillus]|uniref:uncharacterized protein n=1 Tax=Rhizomucor pusillus TaxID=4840 RepID=UPI0037447556
MINRFERHLSGYYGMRGLSDKRFSQVFQPNAMAPTLRSGKRLRSPTPPAASTSRTPRRRRMSVSEETLEETSGEPTGISGESSEISSQAS